MSEDSISILKVGPMHGTSSPHADGGVPVSLMSMVRSDEMTS